MVLLKLFLILFTLLGVIGVSAFIADVLRRQPMPFIAKLILLAGGMTTLVYVVIAVATMW